MGYGRGKSAGLMPPPIIEMHAGMIAMWSGAIATIPDPWILCNGNNGTPDLRDLFIAAASMDVFGTARSKIEGLPKRYGGDDWHEHTATTDGHKHEEWFWDESGHKHNIEHDYQTAQNDTLRADTLNVFPLPYYTLVYIMLT